MPEDLQVISKNIGLRREWFACGFRVNRLILTSEIASRKGGPRIELEKGNWSVPVVHAYGHSGFGYQSSW
jgi:D-amino-acid oxidase